MLINMGDGARLKDPITCPVKLITMATTSEVIAILDAGAQYGKVDRLIETSVLSFAMLSH